MSGLHTRTAGRLHRLAAVRDDDAGLLARFVEHADAEAFAELAPPRATGGGRVPPRPRPRPGRGRRVPGGVPRPRPPGGGGAQREVSRELAVRRRPVRRPAAARPGTAAAGSRGPGHPPAAPRGGTRRRSAGGGGRGAAPPAGPLPGAAGGVRPARAHAGGRGPADGVQPEHPPPPARAGAGVVAPPADRARVAPAVGALLAGAGGANVSATTVEATTASAVAFTNGSAGAVPVTALAREVLAMMGRTKLKVLLAAALVFAGLVGGGVAWGLAAAQPPVPVPPAGRVAADGK